jgi:hypothetical protein
LGWKVLFAMVFSLSSVDDRRFSPVAASIPEPCSHSRGGLDREKV